MPRFAIAVAALLALPLAVLAAEVYTTAGGVALKGYDAVAYVDGGQATRGRDELRFEHAGATYLFASEENRKAFAADPARYLPAYGGYCAFGVSKGYKADIDPAAFSVIGGKLYLNYNAAVQRDWLKDPAEYIRQADKRWDEVRKIAKVLR